MTTAAIATLQRQMEMLTSAVQQLSRSNEQRSKPQTSGTTQFASRRCWNCGKYGHIRSACTSFSTDSQQHRDSHTYSVSGAQERRSGVVNVRQDCRPVGILADVNHTAIVVGDAEINGVA